jgi:hypothetical protein
VHDTRSLRGHRWRHLLERQLAAPRHGSAVGRRGSASTGAVSRALVADGVHVDAAWSRLDLLLRQLAATGHDAAGGQWQHEPDTAGSDAGPFGPIGVPDAPSRKRLDVLLGQLAAAGHAAARQRARTLVADNARGAWRVHDAGPRRGLDLPQRRVVAT